MIWPYDRLVSIGRRMSCMALPTIGSIGRSIISMLLMMGSVSAIANRVSEVKRC